MTSKPKRLGRGLEALLSRSAEPEEPAIRVPVVHPAFFQTGQVPQQVPHTKADSSAACPAIPAASTSQGTPSLSDLSPAGGDPSSQERGPQTATTPSEPSPEPSPSSPVRRIALERIDSNPFQPREDFDPDEMRALTQSLQNHGLLQPVVVRQVGTRYQLIAGERRVRAAELAGWTDVPAQVIQADDREVAELAIVENLHRKDLNPLEKAACFQRYLETYRCTQEELASRLKIDRSTIANLIRLLELPDPIQAAVRQGRLTQGHARALLPLGDPQEQIALAERIQQESLSVRQTEAMVQQILDAVDQEGVVPVIPPGKAGRSRRAPSEHIVALEQEFRSALGTKVKLVHTRSGRGRLVISFRNHEEFERIRKHICEVPARAMRRQAG